MTTIIARLALANRDIAVVGLGAAGTASADSYWPFSGPQGDHSRGAMWVDVQNQLPGWPVPKTETLAQAMCHRMMVDGLSEGELIAEIADGDSAGISGITFVVHAAEWHYCPTLY